MIPGTPGEPGFHVDRVWESMQRDRVLAVLAKHRNRFSIGCPHFPKLAHGYCSSCYHRRRHVQRQWKWKLRKPSAHAPHL